MRLRDFLCDESDRPLRLGGYDHSRFVAVRWRHLTSNTGTYWTACHSGIAEWMDGIVYRDGNFVATIDNRPARVSADGVKRTQAAER